MTIETRDTRRDNCMDAGMVGASGTRTIQTRRNAGREMEQALDSFPSRPASRVARPEAKLSVMAKWSMIAVSLTLAACATPPSAPNYDPTWPESIEMPQASSGAIYQSGREVALFENSTARRIGDTVTIRLQESTNASKSSTTGTKKATSVDIGAPTGIGSQMTLNGAPLGLGLENSNSFSGSGNSAQSNKLEGQITVTVAKRLSNGNLLVRGQKWLTLNQGSEFVRVQGIIRPVDIDPDNSIPSYKVADAAISYGGKGALADANAPGLLSRFFNFKWAPF